MKHFTSIAAAVFTAAFLTAATSASAQDSNINQRTFLTFSGPVQMPGVTLPAGKYVFRLADTSLHNVMQVFDGDEKKIIGQWFFIPKNRTSEEASAANGKPVVMFREMPEGMTPAIQYYFYPTDLTGKEFIYPKDQALKIAAATHQAVLATDTDASKGGDAHVFRVEPNGTESQYEANATASATTSEKENTNVTSEPQPSSSTASLNSQADVNNSPASGPPAYSTAANDQSTAGAAATSGTSSDNSRPTATSGAYDQNQNASPRQQASAELPRTASPLPLFGLIGLIALTAGFGLRLARSTY
ncbi:MAG TPA: hypothetical protein VN654_14980 [Vicinamibacterales bacterium]|jgi:hypothetical protein|nr:hypothetical protein [Vicinamibacterales bacterium]